MSKYKFEITVTDKNSGHEPMDEAGIRDYILLRLQSQSVIQVKKIKKIGV